MDSKRAAVRQVKALEDQAETINSIDDRLSALEAKVDELLGLARELAKPSTNGKSEDSPEPAKTAKSKK